jgi:hypothetical protein
LILRWAWGHESVLRIFPDRLIASSYLRNTKETSLSSVQTIQWLRQNSWDGEGVGEGLYISRAGLPECILPFASKEQAKVITDAISRLFPQYPVNKPIPGSIWFEALRFWHTFGMACFAGLGFCCRSIPRGLRFLLCVVGIAVGWSGAALAGQDMPVQQDVPIPTLHVYTNTIQLPVLVLDSDRERILKPIKANRFSVSIDSGPWFRASHVRQEGDDPISLSILLDVRGGVELMAKIDEAIGGLVPAWLRRQDQISIYVQDCALVGATINAAAGRKRLKRAVDLTLEQWTARKSAMYHPECQETLHLWDSLAYLVQQTSRMPGRRVILAVTDGVDKGSMHPWNEVRTFAQAKGATVFGLKYVPRPSVGHPVAFHWSSEDPFLSLCELSGGAVLIANQRSLDTTFKLFTKIVRERYLVEFPRPGNSTHGQHTLDVRIDSAQGFFIRPAGIAVPLPDARVMSDPSTVPSDPSLAPTEGTRRILTQPQ